jgi:amino acid adenylation domain-containing protein
MERTNKLERKNIQDILALTPVQEGIFFHYLNEPDSDSYFVQLYLELSGDIDRACFEHAWNSVVQRREMLRTLFRWEKLKRPTQVILKEHRLEPRYYETGPGRSLEDIKAADRGEAFNLAGVPFRVTLCQLGKKRYGMLVSSHHILYDGWSSGILLNDFFTAYSGLKKGGLAPGDSLDLPPLTGFKEFVKWVEDWTAASEQEAASFWKTYLQGIDERSEIPVKTKFERGDKQVSPPLSVSLDKGPLEAFASRDKVTLASLIYTAWGLLSQRYSSSGDVVLGTTVSGRPAALRGIENMVGLFINTLPLRVKIKKGETPRQLVKRINREQQERDKFEHTPPVDINRYSGAGSELFDAIVVVENYPLELDRRAIKESCGITPLHGSIVEQPHYDLTVTVSSFEFDNDIKIDFNFNAGVFQPAAIQRLSRHFIRLLGQIVQHPETPVLQLEILSPEEKRQLLVDFNGTAADYPYEETIHGLFDRQARRSGDRAALVFMDHTVTYRELNRRAGCLAANLRKQGVFLDDIVGIKMERSIEMIAGILGILKAGAAYMPIDPDYPRERIDYMLKDSSARLLLAKESAAFSRHPVPGMIPLPGGVPEGRGGSLAYVIYTSGSTGKPKGVLVEHRSVVNLLTALQRAYPLLESGVYLLKTSYLFDVSVTELFGWCLAGGRLAILDPGGHKDPGKLIAALRRHCVTHINFVPSMFSAFVEYLKQYGIGVPGTLEYIFLAGEALPPELVRQFRRLHPGAAIALENLYGPTEAAVYAAGYSLSQWDGAGGVPIGSPLPNVRLHILDPHHRLQPIGVPGELHIAGDGLARGYLNRPGLTNDKFVSPASKKKHLTGKSFCRGVQGGRFFQKAPPLPA